MTKHMYFQGIFHLIVVHGLSVLRVSFGALPTFLCNSSMFLLINGSILFAAITVAMYTFARFMFVCVWKRMRQMDDNLIVRIATIQAAVMSLLFSTVELQINGQNIDTWVQVSFLFLL